MSLSDGSFCTSMSATTSGETNWTPAPASCSNSSAVSRKCFTLSGGTAAMIIPSGITKSASNLSGFILLIFLLLQYNQNIRRRVHSPRPRQSVLLPREFPFSPLGHSEHANSSNNKQQPEEPVRHAKFFTHLWFAKVSGHIHLLPKGICECKSVNPNEESCNKHHPVNLAYSSAAEAGARAEPAHDEACTHHHSANNGRSEIRRVNIYQIEVNPSEQAHEEQSKHACYGPGEEDLQNDGVIAVEDAGELAAR